MLRILIFYIGTMVVLMTLAPWDEVGLNASPFVQIFSNIGVPAAANILNFVVIVAALSVYNSSYIVHLVFCTIWRKMEMHLRCLLLYLVVVYQW